MSGFSFTAEQQAAIDQREGPLLLAANAGSGKTSVLVERYVAMVTEDDIAPGAILAVTFTDRAAGEMRARIRRLLIERDAAEHVAAAEAAWISTLHGFCNRVLRQHAVVAGIDPRYRLLDDGEARALRERAFDAAMRVFVAGGESHVALAAAFGSEQLAGEIFATYDLLRTRGMREPHLPASAGGASKPDADRVRATVAAAIAYAAGAGEQPTVLKALASAEAAQRLFAIGAPPLAKAHALRPPRRIKALDDPAYGAYDEAICAYLDAAGAEAGSVALAQIDELLAAFGAAYAEVKTAAGAIDYADLELLTRDLLLANDGLRASYRDRFERVMVDEFQDINPLQLELLELLDSGNTFVVGDEFQSIYGFRHANVEVFRARRADLQEQRRALMLSDNFRSHPDVLAVLNGLFKERFGARFNPLSGGQSANALGRPRVELLITDRDWTADPDDEERDLAWRGPEARIIASRVAELIEAGTRPRDIAILLRAASDMHIYERALELRDIPTIASGGRGFWARRQIRDLLAFLAALANPRDELEFFGLLASPLAGISSTGLVQIADAAGKGEGRWDAILRGADELQTLAPADADALARFRGWFEPLRARVPQMSLSALLDHAITELGYDIHVLSLPAGRRRLANLFKLQRLAAQFEDVNGRDIRGFVDRARAELDADAREPEAPIELGDADAVQLMTMHAAKGLEFGVVICADLGRAPRTGQGRILVDGDRIGLRLPVIGADPINTFDYEALCEEAKQRDAAEEDRILYVALTRAQELLILSGGEKLEPWPEAKRGCAPIRWIAPAVVPELSGHVEQLTARPVPGRCLDAIEFAVLTRSTEQQLLVSADDDPQSALRINEFAAPDPVSSEPPPTTGSQMIDRLSYSSLSLYGKCSYQYYLRYVLSLPERHPGELGAVFETPAGLDPRVRGVIVHSLLEDLDLRDPRVPTSEDVQLTAAAIDDADELDDAEIAECIALVRAFIESDLIARLARLPRLRNEQGFAFALGPALVNGFIDVLGNDGGHAVVVDYKSDQVTDAEDLEQRVETDYRVQRVIYALAALHEGAASVDVTHLYLNRPGEPATATFGRDQIEALEREIEARAAGMVAGHFEPTEVPHRDLCAFCPGRGGMCSWGPEMTDRDLPAQASGQAT